MREEKQRWLDDVSRALKAEQRGTERMIGLHCLQVDAVENARDIFRLQIGSQTDFDWSWEGSRVWSPGVDGASNWWQGEVVEVDESRGDIYVAVTPVPGSSSPGAAPPTVGKLFVTPFGFLEALNSIYGGAKPAGTSEALQDIFPFTLGEGRPQPIRSAVDQGEFARLWSWSWGILWGPPGTGKTFTTGQLVARATQDPTERVLVVSTTNRATDGVAVAVGTQLQQIAPDLLAHVSRVGSGADVAHFQAKGLERLLEGGAALARWQFSDLRRRHESCHDPEERAKLWAELQRVRKGLAGSRSLQDPGMRTVVTTSFMALREVAEEATQALIASGSPPFTTVVVDEAGLISRAAVTALATLASRRVLLVGDPRQLSPISKMARVLPPAEARWLAESGLAHLDAASSMPANTHFLYRQYRMHSEIRAVVSRFQYGNKLEDGKPDSEPNTLDDALLGQPRAIWYVLDEEASRDPSKLPKLRADRGPGNKSSIRRISEEVVDRILRAHPKMRREVDPIVRTTGALR